jgi:hypothetical protein
MTPKEKAEELVLKYLRLQEKDSYNWFNKKLAKECALIAVDEIQKIPNIEYSNNKNATQYDYWEEVKQEIEKL